VLAPRADPLLSVRGLTKRFGPRTVLAGIDLDVRSGEVLGLIGPNGAGKTTLFDCLAGLLPSDDGRMVSGGAEIPPERRREVLFYVPDAISPWAGQPAGRVLEELGAVFGRSGQHAVGVGTRLGLGPLLAARVGTLSKGERKRLTLALGLLSTAPVLLYDEPFDGLDPRQARDVSEVLRGEAVSRALFLSIHQPSDASRVCDRLVLLSAGHVAGEGTIADLRERAGLDAGRGGGADVEEVFLALT
jgi:ABC-2 type transport system ATP-binding protein